MSEQEKKRVRLGLDFYRGGAESVAPALLGKLLCRNTGGEIIRERITETECYCGREDSASPAHRHSLR